MNKLIRLTQGEIRVDYRHAAMLALLGLIVVVFLICHAAKLGYVIGAREYPLARYINAYWAERALFEAPPTYGPSFLHTSSLAPFCVGYLFTFWWSLVFRRELRLPDVLSLGLILVVAAASIIFVVRRFSVIMSVPPILITITVPILISSRGLSPFQARPADVPPEANDSARRSIRFAFSLKTLFFLMTWGAIVIVATMTFNVLLVASAIFLPPAAYRTLLIRDRQNSAGYDFGKLETVLTFLGSLGIALAIGLLAYFPAMASGAWVVNTFYPAGWVAGMVGAIVGAVVGIMVLAVASKLLWMRPAITDPSQ